MDTTPPTIFENGSAFETGAAVQSVRQCRGLTSLADILRDIFRPGLCDFCPNEGRLYPDPGTGKRFCLDCLLLEMECNRRGLSLTDAVPDEWEGPLPAEAQAAIQEAARACA